MAKSPFIKETNVRELPCVLTEAEMSQRAQDTAQKLAQIDEIESQRKSANIAFKKQLTALNADMRQLSREFREGRAMRDVPCELWIYPDEDRAELVRTDTGEVIFKRALEPSEKQGNLFQLVREQAAE